MKKVDGITVGYFPQSLAKDKSQEMYLVVRADSVSKMAVIRLNYKELDKERVYYVESAMPVRNSYLKNKELLWIGAHPND